MATTNVDKPMKLHTEHIEVFKDQLSSNDRVLSPTAYSQLTSILFLKGYDAAAVELSMLPRKVDDVRENFIITIENETLRQTVDDMSNTLARRGFWRAAGL